MKRRQLVTVDKDPRSTLSASKVPETHTHAAVVTVRQRPIECGATQKTKFMVRKNFQI